MTTQPATEPVRNEVHLTGRLAADPEERALPSGDRLVAFRVVVERAEPGRVDTVDCAAWSASARRSALRWSAGDVVAVSGALRRRFWRSPAGTASRYEVEVCSGRRLSRR